ncbi:hypothetical protein EST38_g10273 [Candolleomyces aberdarensis]|uniref:Uncharacterized protein n=1 Tax=Candolleomyces aberdarensis TaxID=2316362 RepID=A0A4Q2D8H1_9AGAR|nr:hypothetical protein EST38_g10273 [Candolleomyces aberdarensis]
MPVSSKYETRLIRLFARELIVAKFYERDLNIFWKRVWMAWIDFKPFPRHPDMDLDEYRMRCQAQIKKLKSRVRWVLWSYPAAVRNGERSVLDYYVDQYELMIALNSNEDIKAIWMNECILALHNHRADLLPVPAQMPRFRRAVEIALQSKVDYRRARGEGYMLWLGRQFAGSMRVALGDDAEISEDSTEA